MFLVYYDESGDDGFPSYASPLFVLTALYGPALDWRENFEIVAKFKHQLVKEGILPFKTELHTRELLTNKKPYTPLGLTGAQRVEIISRYCQMASQLNVRVITTAVIKPLIRATKFSVLDKALSYSVNRIETDMRSSPENRFLIITDEGRVAKMRSTTRRMQRINYVPSQFGTESYRREIHQLIEDPLPKDSRESYFIQLADMVACIFYLHLGVQTGHSGIPSRAPEELTPAVLTEWLETLKPIFNLNASRDHPYGLVTIPKG
jgi:hypothetical protein